ncbi:hypothetical protein B0H34DRAFT_390616 [Crassisporium funariophilum]|nr:hypothetical protein B0H34DRAFT_390616 [Crassisporium funariophilum]
MEGIDKSSILTLFRYLAENLTQGFLFYLERLLLTLCKSGVDNYSHAIIPFPESYQAAVREASSALRPYMGNLHPQANDVVLKCALRRANGTGAWGSIRASDWHTVIRPDDEIGFFIRQDSLDLPYEPAEGHRAVAMANRMTAMQINNQRGTQGNRNMTVPTQLKKTILYLTVVDKGSSYAKASAVIEAPETYGVSPTRSNHGR